MLTHSPLSKLQPLRDTITKAYRMDETKCLSILLSAAALPEEVLQSIAAQAKTIVLTSRGNKRKQSKINSLLHQYNLSTEEGVALMCLAEALLRIPDKATLDKFISDKLSKVDWKSHLSDKNPLFVNAATWSLFLTGKIYAPASTHEKTFSAALKRASSRLGSNMIRPAIRKLMRVLGKEFVMGETIESACKNSSSFTKKGYLFSYDMLGESARCSEDAAVYFKAYQDAIIAVGKTVQFEVPEKNSGISVKLSGLTPRYEVLQSTHVKQQVIPLLLKLAQLAKSYNVNLTVDAEEADRLDLSLDIFEAVFADATLRDWHGLGLALQAYQKRAYYVIDWLAALSQKYNKRIMLRLVKGAYWDAEIKYAQVQGLADYPVFTRKDSTDVSYLACAKKMLANRTHFYSQFGTHNAYSIAAIIKMAGNHTQDFEFQCLHGMGEPVYDQFVMPNAAIRARIYAPVGTHKDLLGYLVRRLLENGANTSFINKIYNEALPLNKIIFDPMARIGALSQKPNPNIPLPKNIYKLWENSSGIDLSDINIIRDLKHRMDKFLTITWVAAPIINGKSRFDKSRTKTIVNPANISQAIGNVAMANEGDIEDALATAVKAESKWANTPIAERAALLEKTAQLLEQETAELLALLAQEGGRSVVDAISEVREAIDYCRYYAYRARLDFKTLLLPSPTGETNELSLHPRGVIICISPWNFPLAIFTGQILAALVTGNTVIAKPAEQTPLIAYKLVSLLYKAGVPSFALQLLPGKGNVGKKLVSDPRIAGVMFTGSTATAKDIEKSLANRQGPQAILIAETGGQNAMIVDSSALPEQTLMDVIQSAFNSAGQRCSALRVLFIQEEIAPRLIALLQGYMKELIVGDPKLLDTDVGPLIDATAKEKLLNHYAEMGKSQKLLAKTAVTANLNGHFFAPCMFEISDLSVLKEEHFGPILHVIRYRANELDKVIQAIKKTGYGLTLGIQSRIETTIKYIIQNIPVGNIYINRNIIGAVVGVQPFGGEKLSGTGPKAGGPHYLSRLCVERTVSTNVTAVGGNARLISMLEED